MIRSFSTQSVGRRGFSLLEVLCAMALASMLLAAIYQGLHLYWKYSLAARAELEQSQIARAVLRRISLDIRSVFFIAPNTTSTSSGNSSTSSSSGSTSSESGASPASWPSGVVGSASAIILHAARPQTGSLLAGASDALAGADSQAETVIVTYEIGSGVVGDGSTSNSTTGLLRAESPRIVSLLSNTLSVAGSKSEILAPEVTGIQFRYYDGATWSTQWDSVPLGGLPRCVEVTVQLAPSTLPNSSKEPAMYRSVIALSTAAPLEPPTQ